MADIITAMPISDKADVNIPEEINCIIALRGFKITMKLPL
jgi:hypothetical protein